tara:strand:+ start:1310 stop:1462 length:153 start_codon:yes stop_codon:yes gene_type:complete
LAFSFYRKAFFLKAFSKATKLSLCEGKKIKRFFLPFFYKKQMLASSKKAL